MGIQKDIAKLVANLPSKEEAPSHPNLDAIRIWVEGLESDEFEQGQGRLAMCELVRDDLGGGLRRTNKRLCCLGVASELAIRNGVGITTIEHRNPGDNKIIFEYDGEVDFLPTPVQRWLGIGVNNPTLKVILEDGTVIYRRASDLNDGDADGPSVNDGPTESLPQFTYQQIAKALRDTYLAGEAHEETK